jgi:hypothetical protein
MKPATILKTIAVTATVFGLVMGFFEEWFSPNPILVEDSAEYPGWLTWSGLAVTALGSLSYVAIDVFDRNRKAPPKTEK